MNKTTKTNEKQSKKLLGVALILVGVIAVFAGIFALNRPKTTTGSKAFTVTVIDDNGASTVYDGHTNQEYLRGALEELEGFTITGTESEYGLLVEKINGISAVYDTDGAYWSFYVNDEYCNYGVDSQPVNDGDAFKIEYTPAQ